MHFLNSYLSSQLFIYSFLLSADLGHRRVSIRAEITGLFNLEMEAAPWNL